MVKIAKLLVQFTLLPGNYGRRALSVLSVLSGVEGSDHKALSGLALSGAEGSKRSLPTKIL